MAVAVGGGCVTCAGIERPSRDVVVSGDYAVLIVSRGPPWADGCTSNTIGPCNRPPCDDAAHEAPRKTVLATDATMV